MNQKRLLEITSTISMLDGPIILLGYLTSLGESDMYLFLSYVKGSKYKDLNFYDAIKGFSEDYIKDKPVLENNPVLKQLGYCATYSDFSYNYGFNSGYLEEALKDDASIKLVDSGRKR